MTIHLLNDSVMSLSDLYRHSESNIVFSYNAELNNLFSESFDFEGKYALHVGNSQIYQILEKVKNLILDWSITLEEKGILGEDLVFSEREKNIAKQEHTINNYINVFYGDSSNVQIQQSSQNSTQKI